MNCNCIFEKKCGDRDRIIDALTQVVPVNHGAGMSPEWQKASDLIQEVCDDRRPRVDLYKMLWLLYETMGTDSDKRTLPQTDKDLLIAINEAMAKIELLKTIPLERID